VSITVCYGCFYNLFNGLSTKMGCGLRIRSWVLLAGSKPEVKNTGKENVKNSTLNTFLLLKGRIVKMGVSEEKKLVYAILVSEERIKNLGTDGVGYSVIAFPEQLVVEGPTAFKARDHFTLNNLTYEQVVKPQYKNHFKTALEKPEANAQFIEILVKATMQVINQNFPDEEYSRVWKVIKGPVKGRFKKTPTKILAIGIYKN